MQALCGITLMQAIVFDACNLSAPVKGDTTLYDTDGNVDYTANSATTDCGITPDDI